MRILKAKKADLKAKHDESTELVRTAQEAAAKATGDKEALERISAEREAESQNKLVSLQTALKLKRLITLLMIW